MEFNASNSNFLEFDCLNRPIVVQAKWAIFPQERMMPGVIMATECKAFDKLYQLAELEEPRLVEWSWHFVVKTSFTADAFVVL